MTYKQMLENFPKPTVLNEYTCKGCGEDVKVTEMAIAGGPDKGKLERFYLGCRCSDRVLAEMVIENEKKARMNHFKSLFDQNSLVNESLRRATFENYQPPSQQLAEAKQVLQHFTESFNTSEPKSYLLRGTYGTGKSHLSYAVTKELLEKGHSALFLSTPKLLTKIKDTYKQRSEVSESELLDFMASVDLLVLDDLGAEYTNVRNNATDDNWAITKLFEVIDGRAGKSTIYTTNLNSQQLEKKLGYRNFSRISDDLQPIIMDGIDYRRKHFLGGQHEKQNN